jgi:hypothetical protein
MKKQYIVPDEIHEIWCKYTGYVDLRDIYVKRPFGYKKAVRAARDAEIARYKFWHSLRKVFPELTSSGLTYNAANKTVSIEQPKDEK